MFAWVGTQFDAVLSTYVIGVVNSLMTGIAPIAPRFLAEPTASRNGP